MTSTAMGNNKNNNNNNNNNNNKQELAAPHLKQSAVSKMDSDVGKPTEEWRTSSTHFLQKVEILLS